MEAVGAVVGADSCSEGWEQQPSPAESCVLWESSALCSHLHSTALMLTGTMLCELFQDITTAALLTISSVCFMSFISSFLMKNPLLFVAFLLRH